MEKVKLYIILEEKLAVARNFSSAAFIACLTEIFLTLNNMMLIVGKKMYIEKSKTDLFEYFKDQRFFESYNVTIFKTKQGSIYFFDNATGACWRFKTDFESEIPDERKMYEIMDPSHEVGFVYGNELLSFPKIGAHPNEQLGDNNWHAGHQIVEVYPDVD